MDDAAISQLMAEMDAMRVRQQQQAWDLQAKLGMMVGSEIDALTRPELPETSMAARDAPALHVPLRATGMRRPHRAATAQQRAHAPFVDRG